MHLLSLLEYMVYKAESTNLHFVAYLAASLTPFLKLFQTDEPLVHVLYDKVNELTRTCLRMFLKPEVVEGNEGIDLIAVDCEKVNEHLGAA